MKKLYIKNALVFCTLLSLISNSCKKEEAIEKECTPPAPPKASHNGPVGIGDTLKFKAETISGATYSWRGPNSFSSNSREPYLIFNTSYRGEYLVTVTGIIRGSFVNLLIPPKTLPQLTWKGTALNESHPDSVLFNTLSFTTIFK